MKVLNASLALLSLFSSVRSEHDAKKKVTRNLRGKKHTSLNQVHINLNLEAEAEKFRKLNHSGDSDAADAKTSDTGGAKSAGSDGAKSAGSAGTTSDGSEGAKSVKTDGDEKPSGGGGKVKSIKCKNKNRYLATKDTDSGGAKSAASGGAKSTGSAGAKSAASGGGDAAAAAGDCKDPGIDVGEDVLKTPENTPLTVDADTLLANDMNKEGGSLVIQEFTQPVNGGIIVDDNGGFVYTPVDGFVGVDTFQYAVGDGIDDGMTIGTITIIVGNVGNLPPVLRDDLFGTAQNSPLTITGLDILGNDIDYDNDRLTISTYSPPANGVIIKNSDGGFTYTPTSDFIGEDTFTYTVIDNMGGSSTATITIDVGNPNSGPMAMDDSITAVLGSILTFDTEDLLSNDSHTYGDDLSIDSYTKPGEDEGMLTRRPNGSFSYVPMGFLGDTTFTYTVIDTTGATSTATVTITVTGTNKDPIAVDDIYTADENGELVILAPGLLENDSDPDGNDMTVESTTKPSNGNLKPNGDGSFTYKPDKNFNGVDSFTYTVVDSNGGTRTATVFITVGTPNTEPVAVDDSYSTSMETELVIASPGVLVNDVDGDGDELEIDDFTEPANGELELDKDGELIYTPNDGFSGFDSFTYTVSDGNDGTSTATVTINVVSVTADPVAVDDAYNTFANTPLIISMPGVLENDVGVVSVSSWTAPSAGTLTANGNGSFTYTPPTNYVGVVTYNYTVMGANGASTTAKVTILVNNRVTPPMIVPGSNSDLILIGSGGIGVAAGTSSDCTLGFTNCADVTTVSQTSSLTKTSP